jgi:hypothetical protein
MRSLLKRNFLVALICALPAVLGVESAIGHSGAGSSSAAGSSGGHGGGHGGAIPASAPSGGHSSTALNSAHMSGASLGGHSSTGLNSPHMSGASLGGHFTTNPLTNVTGTGDAAPGRFVHTGTIRTSPDQSAKQRQFGTGYVPSNLQGNDELRRKRHRYHRFYPLGRSKMSPSGSIISAG